MTTHDTLHKPSAAVDRAQTAPESLPSQNRTTAQILRLQRTIGNQAVQRLLAKTSAPKTRRRTAEGRNPLIQRLIINAQKQDQENAYVIDESVLRQKNNSQHGGISLHNDPNPQHQKINVNGDTLYIHGHGDGVDTIGGYKPAELFQRLNLFITGTPSVIDLRACNPTHSRTFVENFAVAGFNVYGMNLPTFIGSSGTSFTDEQGEERTHNDVLLGQANYYKQLFYHYDQLHKTLKNRVGQMYENQIITSSDVEKVDQACIQAYKDYHAWQEYAKVEAKSRPRDTITVTLNDVLPVIMQQVQATLSQFQGFIPPLTGLLAYPPPPQTGQQQPGQHQTVGYDPEHPEYGYGMNRPYSPTMPHYDPNDT